MAPASVIALLGNATVWWSQLVGQVVFTTGPSSSLSAALEYTAMSSSLATWWRLSTFGVYINVGEGLVMYRIRPRTLRAPIR